MALLALLLCSLLSGLTLRGVSCFDAAAALGRREARRFIVVINCRRLLREFNTQHVFTGRFLIPHSGVERGGSLSVGRFDVRTRRDQRPENFWESAGCGGKCQGDVA